jgi:hypothetical protein
MSREQLAIRVSSGWKVAHNVMRMACQDGDNAPVLPVP